MERRSRIWLFVLLFCGLWCVPLSAQTTTVHARPSSASSGGRGWLETRLYFGLGPASSPEKGVSEAAWQAFLDAVVTPRFPAGLSVADVYGQWQGKTGNPIERLRSKVLILNYPANQANAARVEEIRTEWKRRTGDISVMRVTQPVDVQF